MKYVTPDIKPHHWVVLFLLLAAPKVLIAEEIVVHSVLISLIDAADVPARDTGVIDRIHVREGDHVEQGDLLLQLDSREAEILLQRAQQELRIAEHEQENELSYQFAVKAADVAKKEWQRATSANDKYPETVSQTDLDRLKLLYEKAEIEKELAERERERLQLTCELRRADVELSQELLQRRQVKAPVAGQIVEINSRPGEYVQTGKHVVSLIGTRRLRAEAVLAGKYRHTDLINRPITILLAGESEQVAEVKGKVQFVHPQIDPVDGSFRIWAEIDNADQKLRPGDSVTMTIHLSFDR